MISGGCVGRFEFSRLKFHDEEMLRRAEDGSRLVRRVYGCVSACASACIFLMHISAYFS